MSSDNAKLRFPDGEFEIPGLSGRYVADRSIRYDYEKDKCVCPKCGGLACPWGGWYACDGPCGLVAWIETGECMLPVKAPLRESLAEEVARLHGFVGPDGRGRP